MFITKEFVLNLKNNNITSLVFSTFKLPATTKTIL